MNMSSFSMVDFSLQKYSPHGKSIATAKKRLLQCTLIVPTERISFEFLFSHLSEAIHSLPDRYDRSQCEFSSFLASWKIPKSLIESSALNVGWYNQHYRKHLTRVYRVQGWRWGHQGNKWPVGQSWRSPDIDGKIWAWLLSTSPSWKVFRNEAHGLTKLSWLFAFISNQRRSF